MCSNLMDPDLRKTLSGSIKLQLMPSNFTHNSQQKKKNTHNTGVATVLKQNETTIYMALFCLLYSCFGNEYLRDSFGSDWSTKFVKAILFNAPFLKKVCFPTI